MRRTSIISLTLFLTLTAAGCAANESGATSAVAPVTAEATGPSEAPPARAVASYRGVLPCADCSGIRTELTLFENDAYRLEQTYLGTRDGDRTFTSEGLWRTQRGTAADPGATVYRLEPAGTDEPQSFLVLDEQRIEQLDREGRRIESRLDYVLTKVPGQPPFD